MPGDDFQALTERRDSKVGKATLEFVGYKDVVRLVARQQLRSVADALIEHPGSCELPTFHHGVPGLDAEDVCRQLDKLPVGQPPVVTRQMPGLALGVGAVAEQRHRAAGIRGVDQRA